MEVAVYGGSFNPPHVGHAMVAAWLHWTGQVDEVWLVPAFDHAFDKALAPFELRMEACRRMARDLGSWAHARDIEAHLPAPSYTIHTLDALSAAHPKDRFRLVVGADVLESLHLWRDWTRIMHEYPLITVGRAGYKPVLEAPAFPDISSTDIRCRLKEQRPVSHLLSKDILALIMQNPDIWWQSLA
jgi:nicotinate-nucleotide adenylyltransferase